MLTFIMAFRSIFLHKLKTFVIGLIIIFGTVLAILGNSFVDAITGGMKHSLTSSVTGDIQIYSSDARERLSVFGNMDGSTPEIGHVNDFKRVKETLLAEIPNIRSIVPMGSSFAMVNPGNLLDVKLEELRTQLGAKDRNAARTHELKDHIRAIIATMQETRAKGPRSDTFLASDDELLKAAPANLKRALSNAFWSGFDADHENRIEFLANKIAPLIVDDTVLYLPFVGSVPGQFKANFPLFEIVKGEEIPPGKRGFLFNDFIYENMVKHKVARRLDSIKKDRDKKRVTIAATKELKDKVTANVGQAAEIYYQLTPKVTEALIPKLQKELGSKERSIRPLTEQFLGMDDSNFEQRYRFFYDEIAPHLILYKVKIGDIFPMTAFTSSGYSASVNMKVYGTFRFKSFESSPIAGNFNLVDMISFRELFGFMTEEKRKQTRDLEEEMGVKDLDRGDIESLFAGPSKYLERETRAKKPGKAEAPSPARDFKKRREVFNEVYSDAEMEEGVFLNAAILLKDPKKIDATLLEITRVSEKEKLGIKAVSWSEASGMVGQLTTVVRIVLLLSVSVIFIIATFIIMNSLLMTTLERTREIGTMRAIGAQKGFLFSLLLHETVILSFFFGIVGTLIATGFIMTVGRAGIPAHGDVATFFFSGDRLYLQLNFLHIAIVFGCMILVAIVSTQYPAWKAMRVSPLKAMQETE